MAPKSSIYPYEQHEERIQKLEANLGELSMQIATTSTDIKYISQKIEDSASQISNKIETVMSVFSEKLSDHISDDKVLANEIKDLKDNLDKTTDKVKEVESRHLSSEIRIRSFKKFGLALLLAGGTVFVERISMYLIHLFSK